MSAATSPISGEPYRSPPGGVPKDMTEPSGGVPGTPREMSERIERHVVAAMDYDQPTPPAPPRNPLIEELRDALAAYDCATSTPTDRLLRAANVISAARGIVAEHDRIMAETEAMLTMPRPTAEEVKRALLRLESGGT